MGSAYCKVVAIHSIYVHSAAMEAVSAKYRSCFRLAYNFVNATQLAQQLRLAVKNSEILIVDTSDFTRRALNNLNEQFYCIYPGEEQHSDMSVKHQRNCRMTPDCIHIEIQNLSDFERLNWEVRPDAGLRISRR
ncbi:hypothetical protein RAY_264 [Erwinia phage vB_EamM_RAY]|uniref:Uncharacterized protein n=3 Tax=Agricanvirus ray TaxID=1984779 RepID=A0A173GEB5_9CAUD|nr:hypothetical protein FDH98_gp254 [Erwinia phage vB_EamM_RAY]ANH52044.1 hypothetical protein RAY_264 [Erwinia phage vB_EamM_RAY]AUG87019.1 hypothetical protein MORTIMER_271 [Erwinia phage vB_EamM_Mortimer]QBP07371.1 hypothetical protein REBECCA_266 [Erwinia phage Rebecca]